MTSPHFEDFAPILIEGPPATYSDEPDRQNLTAQMMMFQVFIAGDYAGWLWTDHRDKLGVIPFPADDVNWDVLADLRASIARQFALGQPAGLTANRILLDTQPDKFVTGPQALVPSLDD